jgi:multifunctional methyltransferase subunit TRM112
LTGEDKNDGIMRLLTHNLMRNNTEGAGGNGFPLKITATEIRVDAVALEQDAERQVAFVKGVLGVIDWPALVQAASQMGLSTLPPQLSENMANDPTFLQALYQILMNVHLVKGILTCPVTGREFAVSDGIPNMMLEEEECEHIRM